MAILISADELARRLEDDTRTVVLDVRWTLARPDGREAFRAGHVPGAISVDLDHELADHDAIGQGRHPLPSESSFTATMRGWGIHDGDTVVVMDDVGNQSSARAWWLLRHAGVADVRMLDGALAAWIAAGHPLETGDGTAPATGDATAHFGSMPVIDADAAAAVARSGVLLDARAAERYRGEVEPIDPRAGHNPGARSMPSAGNLDGAGRFREPDELRARFEAAGAATGAPVAAYCGSGITAAHAVAALAIAGIDAALFPGRGASGRTSAGDPWRPALNPGDRSAPVPAPRPPRRGRPRPRHRRRPQ